jgi:hypothetical protein
VGLISRRYSVPFPGSKRKRDSVTLFQTLHVTH